MQLGPTTAFGEAAVVAGLLHGFARALLVSLAISEKFVATLFRPAAIRVQIASAMGDLVWFSRERNIGNYFEGRSIVCCCLLMLITCLLTGHEGKEMSSLRRRTQLETQLGSHIHRLCLVSW
jgi:hypothetical protein